MNFPGGCAGWRLRWRFGERFAASSSAQRPTPKKATDPIRRWNEIAINASGLDHTTLAAAENREFGEQIGPGRSSRAMAIIYLGTHWSFDKTAGIEQGRRVADYIFDHAFTPATRR